MHMNRHAQRGLSLIELMISVLLGSLMLLGIVTVFQQSKTNSLQDEQIARMQENGRFALRAVARELSMMGYWGGMLTVDDPGSVSEGSVSLGTDCLAGGWALKTSPGTTFPSLTYENDVAAGDSPFDCIDSDDIVDETDVLAIKRVADQPDRVRKDAVSTPTGNTVKDAVYFKTSTTTGEFFEAGGTTSNGPTGLVSPPWSLYQYRPSIFYVRPYSVNVGDGIPTLMRETLVEDSMVAQPLVEGIENMQIEFGIDGTDTDLAPDYYTPDPSASDLALAVAARIHLLVRSINPVTGYVNDKTYNLGSTVVDPANDGYYRRVYSTVVQLRNSDKLKLFSLN